MKKNYLSVFVYLMLGLLTLEVYGQQNPYKAPLYWSVYEHNWTKEQNHVQDNYIPESEWLTNINWVDQNLKEYGYKMICIDGWGDVTKYNEHGYRTTHSRHWEHDYAWWAKHLQERGMNLGMYNNPLWINREAAEAGVKIKGTDIPLKSLIDYNEEALWFTWVQVDRPGAEEYVKGYVQYYADMGIKFLRVDFLSWYEDGFDKNMGRVGPKRPREHYETALRWMKEACDANGIFLSLVMPHLNNDAELEIKYGHMVRINEDVWNGTWERFSDLERGVHHGSWSQWRNPFDGYTYWSKLAGINKLILDGDFIRLNTMSSDEEKKTIISLHLMAGGPLSPADQHNTIGNNLQFYQNKEMLALNHDGFVGRPLTNDPTDERSQTWKGQLSNGDWIVGFFNRENTARTRSIDFAAELGVKGDAYVRDLWRHEDIGQMQSYSVSVPPRGCVIVKISKNKPTQVNAPSFGQTSGVYTVAQTVTLASTTDGAKVYYTLDGSEPTTASALYTAPFTISGTTTIKAIATKRSLNNSRVVSATYTINMPGPLPSPWQSVDVGPISATGSASFANETFANTGSGEDIEGTADSFHFIYRKISGDATVTAKVASMTYIHDWAKAGVMIRESLDADARNAFTAVTPANGVIFQKRSETGSGTNSLIAFGSAAPLWLRIQRVGDQVSAYHSADGINWAQTGNTETVSMGKEVYIGMAFTSHLDGTLGAASFEQVEVGHAGNAVVPPSFSLEGGTYFTAQTVSLTTSTPGATIYYTTNGDVPGTSSQIYTGPILVSSTTTIKALAAAGGLVNSPVISATFVLKVPNKDVVSGGVYKLIARHSGKALDIVEGSTVNGALVHQWDYFGGNSQKWKLEYLENGYYKITSQHSLKVLDVAGGSQDEGANIHQWDNYDLHSQQWSIVGSGNGYMMIENRNSGKVLDVYGASAENGGSVRQYTYTGSENQQWQLELVNSSGASTAMYVGGTFNDWTLGITPMALENGVWKATGVQINAGDHQLKFANSDNWSGADWGNATGLSGIANLTTGGGPNVSFSIALNGTYTITFDEQSLAYAIVDENSMTEGVYVIRARHSGKALDVVGGSTENGALVHQWDYFGGNSQQWGVQSTGDGYYTVTNLHSGKAMDVVGGYQEDGTGIHQWEAYNNFPSQQWRFVAVGDGYYKVENKNSGKVLDVYGASSDNGGKVNQYTYTGDVHQQWQLELLQSGLTAHLASTSAMHSASEAKKLKSVSFYPNPARNQVTLDLSDFKGEFVSVSIANSRGQQVYSQVVSGGKKVEVNTASYTTGIYYVTLRSNSSIKIEKLIISR